MKKIKSLALGIVFLSFTLFQTGCIGSFKLTQNLYDWNTSLNSKALQEVVFLAFVIIPVYGVTLFIDAVILNTIEFWSGSNPMAMEEGEMEEQIVKNQGNTYKITATKNKFHVEQLDGKKAGQSYDLIYNPDDYAWYLEANGQSKKVAQYDSHEQAVKLFKPDGEVIMVDREVTNPNAVRAAVNLEMDKIPN